MNDVVFGLIGKPLEHSFSKKYFTKKFESEAYKNFEYHNFELDDIESLQGVISGTQGLSGLNVTIPYKTAVIDQLDEIEGTAAQIGAVNTIAINRNIGRSRLKGFNTDYIGFGKALERSFPGFKFKKALILGTGGASKAVEHYLKEKGKEVFFVSRYPGENQFTYEDLEAKHISEFQLIVNTTPVGQYPRVEQKPPLPYDGLCNEHLLYDLIYNPEITGFLAEGKKHGAKILNGRKMLEIQAEESFKIWMKSINTEI